MTIYKQRFCQDDFEKQSIGSYIASYLRKHAAYLPIAIDGGSTNFYVLQAIARDANEKRPTVSQVLTNHLEGIYLARNLPDGEPPMWRCTGGVLRATRAVFIDGEKVIEAFNFGMAVVGVNGFDPPWLQTSTGIEHPVKKTMVFKASNSVIFPIISSKWGQPAGVNLFTLNEIPTWKRDNFRIVLVTCFPIPKEDEFNNEYLHRVDQFLNTIDSLTQHWPYSIEVSAAQVKESETDFTDISVDNMSALGNELRNLHSQGIPSSHVRQEALIIRFDLWAEKPC